MATKQKQQTLEQWFAEFDELSEKPESNKTELLKKAKEVQAKYDPDLKQVPVLVRLAKATFKAAGDAEVAKNKTLHRQLLEQTLKYTDAVFAIEPENGEAHAWAAYACGKLSDYLGTKEKIQKGKQVQLHLEKAIAADPQKYSLHFTFGRWCMEVASLSWMERKIASTLFEKVPEASYDDAIKHFETCEKLKPDWRAVRYWKAKAQICLKKYPDAIKSLDEAAKLPAVEAEDTVIEPDMKSLINKYASYR